VLDEIAQRSGGTARAEFIALDLGDLDSVRQCAQAFNARELPLHLLVNNAGLAGQKGFTKSGFELAFGVCHVGHFLLTRLLLDRLKRQRRRAWWWWPAGRTATPRASTSPPCASPAAAAAA
jgi:NAD(P)-dependent dehydrogenase (short-subunit alcohol dehydrogenase family)